MKPHPTVILQHMRSCTEDYCNNTFHHFVAVIKNSNSQARTILDTLRDHKRELFILAEDAVLNLRYSSCRSLPWEQFRRGLPIRLTPCCKASQQQRSPEKNRRFTQHVMVSLTI